MALQFNISDLYQDVNLDITKIAKDTGTKLNNTLQSYQNIPLKQLFNVIDMSQFPADYFEYTDVIENSLDKVSERLYQNPNYWWLILLVNNIKNPFEFNMSPRIIGILANYLYRTEEKYTEETYFDLLNEYNDSKKKNIKYIKQQYLNDFFRKVLESKNA